MHNNSLSQLRSLLKNWGAWLNHDADIGPRGARCISLESRYIPESGEIWDDETIVPVTDDLDEVRMTPNVADAEAINLLIRQLDSIQQYSLAITYGGAPVVMRWRRVGEHQMHHALEMAEVLLGEMMRKSA